MVNVSECVLPLRSESSYERRVVVDRQRVTRLVVADPYALVLEGLRTVFDAAPGLEVVGAATTVSDLRRLVDELAPDIVLTEAELQDGSPRDLHDEWITRPGAPKVVLLTSRTEDDVMQTAIRLGVRGILLKSLPTFVLVNAVRAVANGGAVLDPTLTRRLFEMIATGPRRVDLRHEQLTTLTERETSVLREMGLGRTNTEIAELLGIGSSTLKTHIGSLFRKLHVSDRAGAVRIAFTSGLVAPTEEP